MFSAANIAVVTLVTIIAVRLAGTETAAGIPSSTTTFSQALTALPLALLMGRYGRRIGLTLGYGLGALGGLVGLLALATASIMSFLAPLYLLGGLAVSLPVLLHLIRRTPRGRQQNRRRSCQSLCIRQRNIELV